MTGPTVSVVIPTYNRAGLLPRALDSIIAQTFDDWHIVLVDDGSTDETLAIAEDYRARLGDRLVYHRQQNLGPGAARNRGIELSKGKFVAFLDSDDEFAPKKLARQLELMQLRPDVAFVYSDYCCHDPNGLGYSSAFDEKFPLSRLVPQQSIAPGLFACIGLLFDTLIEGYFIATITGLVRRDVLADKIRFHTTLHYGEEWLFFLHVSRACRAGFVNEPLSIHHAVQGSLARSDRAQNAIGYAELLRTIASEFRGITAAQSLSLATRLATAYRQIGYDALRAGQTNMAMMAFARAVSHRLELRSLAELLGVLPRRIWNLLTPTPKAPSTAGRVVAR